MWAFLLEALFLSLSQGPGWLSVINDNCSFPEVTIKPTSCHLPSILSLHLLQGEFKQAAVLLGKCNVLIFFFLICRVTGENCFASTCMTHSRGLASQAPSQDLAFIPQPQGNETTLHYIETNAAWLHNQAFPHPQPHRHPHLCSILPWMEWRMDQEARPWYYTMQKQSPPPKIYKSTYPLLNFIRLSKI